MNAKHVLFPNDLALPATCKRVLKNIAFVSFQSGPSFKGESEPKSEIVCNRDKTARSGLGFVSSNLDKARPLRHVLPFESKNFFRAQTGKSPKSQTGGRFLESHAQEARSFHQA